MSKRNVLESLLIFFSTATILLAAPSAARADCTLVSTGVSKPAGYFFYNADFKVMEYCDGANWRMMMGGGIADPALSNLTDVDDALAPADGDVLAYDSASGKWKAGTAGIGVEDDPQVGAVTNAQWCRGDGSAVQCDQAAPAGDNLGDHTATQVLDMSTYGIQNSGVVQAGFTSDANGFSGFMWGNAAAPLLSIGWPGSTANTSFIKTADGDNKSLEIGASTSGSGKVRIITNGTARLTVLKTGEIGVGTSSPNDILHIAGGQLRIDNDTNTTSKGCIRFSGTKLQFSDDCTTFADIGTLTTETDPQVGTLTSSKWCTTDGMAVNCSTNAPVTSESDPQVGATTNNNWCRGDGSAVQCDQSPPTASSVYNAGSSTTINWSNGTTQYTTANCGAFSFSNMADGASYTLIVQGGTSNTCSFSHSGLTFKLPPGHGATTASKQTLYSFTRAGSNVYVTWIKGY